MTFLPSEIIKKKRDKLALDDSEIDFFISSFVKNEIPDYQMSSFLMASFLNGLNFSEASSLTRAMTKSGEAVIFEKQKFLTVDKHSTGGVGDKTSLILAPIVSALGLRVPMIAGRGLGHTGGTLDKLESIPGLSISLTLNEFKEAVNKHNLCIIGQTAELCPADRRIYQLRDVTATVECIPLICASILSKKIAEGSKALVMDIKLGNGAFMKTIEQATELGNWLKNIAQQNDLKFKALITNMDQPLGDWAGNSVEIKECLDILEGKNIAPDTKTLSLRLAAEMLVLCGYSDSLSSAFNAAESVLNSGAAKKEFENLCQRQGGNLSKLELPQVFENIIAPEDGFISGFDTEKIGITGIIIKAGRKKAEDKIDYLSGIQFHKKIGDPITKGEPIFTLWGRSKDTLLPGIKPLSESYKISLKKIEKPRLIELEIN